jgi:OOP family OmpA-OmpF porin
MTMIRKQSPLTTRSVLLASFALLGLERSASAEGFALNRFEPSERGSDWFALESLDLRGRGRFAAGIVGDWAHRPLVIYDGAGNEIQALLKDQVYAYVGASIVWLDRIRLGATFPLVLVSTSDGALDGAPTVPVTSGATLGDLRLSADVRILGEYGEPISVAVGGHVHAPTGESGAFTGDGSFRAQPHILAAGRVSNFEYAARTGINIRALSDFAGAQLGNEWVFAAAGGVRLLDDQLLVGPELWGGTQISSDYGAFDKEGTPIEALLGAHYRFHEWNFGLGAGPGLSRGLGAPTLRALASLQWIQEDPAPAVEPPPPLDLDGDGVLDGDDACVSEAGPASSDPKQNGCPLPLDTDGDQILDPDDACPAERGEPTQNPSTHGCPPPDSDGDGVLDRDDACVSEAGVRDVDPARNGCPLPTDRDGDTIVDTVDACPEQPGQANSDASKHGCPQVVINDRQLQVLDRIEFENGKAILTPDSEAILQAVARLLEEHPEIRGLDVVGHTDARGQRASNMDLSKRRAAAVKQWLIEHGIKAERLSSHGFGPDKPLDSNDTDVGRQRNRRVEFHVTSLEGETPSRAAP